MNYNTYMNGISNAELFFIISSVSFVILWILVAIFLFYLIRATKAFSQIIEKIEGGINKAGDITKEMLGDLRDSAIFNFIFRKKKGRRKN